MKIFKPEIFETKNAPNAPLSWRSHTNHYYHEKKAIFNNLLFVLANELLF